ARDREGSVRREELRRRRTRTRRDRPFVVRRLAVPRAARRGAARRRLTRVEPLVVPAHLCRNAGGDPATAAQDAAWLIDHLCGHLGVPDLDELAVLDVGCGVRFTQAIANRGIPIGRYAGVDVSRDVIAFLRANVADPRFEFFHLDAQNDLYNPNGS